VEKSSLQPQKPICLLLIRRQLRAVAIKTVNVSVKCFQVLRKSSKSSKPTMENHLVGCKTDVLLRFSRSLCHIFYNEQKQQLLLGGKSIFPFANFLPAKQA